MPKHATSTSFKEGNQISKGHGRKGFEYEEKQLKRMTTLLNRAFTLAELMSLNKASIKQQMAYGNIEKLILKIMDKLHSNKEHISVENPEQAQALEKIADSIKKIAEEKENA